jgi:sodium-dependent dicarboxylate transporter 2/3/5
LVLGIVLALFAVLSPPLEGLSRAGQNALGAFFLCLALWITGVLPLAITGLLAIVLLPLLGVMSPFEAFSLFGNSAVFFILGAFILSAGLMTTGLSKRLALLLLVPFGSSPGKLRNGILFTSAFLAFWMPEHAVAAMFFSIVLEIVHTLRLKPLHSKYGASLFIAMAWGSIIGGVTTFLGGARNPLAVGMLRETFGQSIGFLEWVVAVIPAVVVILALSSVMIRWFFPSELGDVESAARRLRSDIQSIGKMSRREMGAGIVMGLTILAWVFLGQRIGVSTLAILGAVGLFVFRIVTWKDVESYVNWGILLMYGGAIALGTAMAQTGAAEWLVGLAVPWIEGQPQWLFFGLPLVTLILTEGMSNAAAVAVILPIAFGFCHTMALNPVVTTFLVAVPSGLAFMFPISTPPNAIAFSSGYYLFKDVAKPGAIMGAASWVIVQGVIWLYWPMIGYHLTGSGL